MISHLDYFSTRKEKLLVLVIEYPMAEGALAMQKRFNHVVWNMLSSVSTPFSGRKSPRGDLQE